MVENRLPGTALHTTWRHLTGSAQKRIIQQIITFLQFLETQKKENIYSVTTGNTYPSFFAFMTESLETKVTKIQKFSQARKLVQDLHSVLTSPAIKKLFLHVAITLVHGDLIIHNLLTDGKKLTGVLDWELSLYGDPDYDICRLLYYHECAMAYKEQRRDPSYEAHYMNTLITAILKSDLVHDQKKIEYKYQCMRAFFYLNALYWATTSDDSDKNINDLIVLWKKSGAKYVDARPHHSQR